MTRLRRNHFMFASGDLDGLTGDGGRRFFPITEDAPLRPFAGITASAVASRIAPTVADIGETLSKIMDTLPRRAGFYSSAVFPNDRAIVIEDDRESLTLAGPEYWDQVKHDPRILEAAQVDNAGELILHGVTIVNLDRSGPEERKRVFDIISKKLGIQL